MSTSTYHLARAARVLAFAGSALLCGVAVLVAVVVETLVDDDSSWSWLGTALVVLVALLLVALARGLWGLVRPPVALRLNEESYVLARTVGSGTRTARWTDVAQVDSMASDQGTVVVVRLHSGASTQIHARLVEEPLQDWTTDLDERLNTAHGQRRL